MTADPDLFGVRRPPRGRPRHEPSSQSRALILKLVIQGYRQAEIAKAVGLSEPTLRLRYPVVRRRRAQ